jgi:hypothetical protein
MRSSRSPRVKAVPRNAQLVCQYVNQAKLAMDQDTFLMCLRMVKLQKLR